MSLYFTDSFQRYPAYTGEYPLSDPNQYRQILIDNGWGAGTNWLATSHWFVKCSIEEVEEKVLSYYATANTESDGILNFQLPFDGKETVMGFTIYVNPLYSPPSPTSNPVLVFSTYQSNGTTLAAAELFRITASMQITNGSTVPASNSLKLIPGVYNVVEVSITLNTVSVFINETLVYQNTPMNPASPIAYGTILAIRPCHVSGYPDVLSKGGVELGNFYCLNIDDVLPNQRIGKTMRLKTLGLGEVIRSDFTKPDTVDSESELLSREPLPTYFDHNELITVNAVNDEIEINLVDGLGVSNADSIESLVVNVQAQPYDKDVLYLESYINKEDISSEYSKSNVVFKLPLDITIGTSEPNGIFGRTDGSVVVVISASGAWWSKPPYYDYKPVPFADAYTQASCYISPSGNILVMRNASPSDYCYLDSNGDPDNDWITGSVGVATTYGLVNDNGYMVACTATMVRTSPDGITWTNKSTGIPANLLSTRVVLIDNVLIYLTNSTPAIDYYICRDITQASLTWEAGSSFTNTFVSLDVDPITKHVYMAMSGTGFNLYKFSYPYSDPPEFITALPLAYGLSLDAYNGLVYIALNVTNQTANSIIYNDNDQSLRYLPRFATGLTGKYCQVADGLFVANASTSHYYYGKVSVRQPFNDWKIYQSNVYSHNLNPNSGLPWTSNEISDLSLTIKHSR